MNRGGECALMENVEPRRMLAVNAVLDGSTVHVTSDAAGDYVSLSTQHRKDGTSTVRSGTTSVFLDLPLLKAAANLELSGANSAGTPASSAYQVGFPITKLSDFRYNVSPFSPVSGEIEHKGTVSFNSNTITVGDFSIGYDAARASSTRSGFFVKDNVAGLGILFDVGAPRTATINEGQFKVDADLLVSPEFASGLLTLGLASSNLTGADVGNALVHASARENLADFIVATGRGFEKAFRASSVNGIDAKMNGGDDTVSVLNIHKRLSIDLGAGRDRAFVVGGSNALKILGGDGNDYVNLSGGHFSSVEINTGANDDTVTSFLTRVSGSENINGGSGHDRFYSIASSIKGGDTSNFEWRSVI